MLSGNIDVVELLIKRGANILAENNEGEQPLHLAAAEDYSDIVVMLAKGGKKLMKLFRQITFVVVVVRLSNFYPNS